MTARLYERGSVGILSIDRQHHRNAVDRATAQALLDGLRRFEANSELKVLVVTGSGNSFCAGADLKALDNDVDAPEGPMGFTRLRAAKPTIAAIEGYCVAGGLEIALFCDLRIAGRASRFGFLERRWGVPLIDGGTQRLPRIIGLGRALDLVMTGRLIDTTEAEQIGLVNRVVESGTALEAAVSLGKEIAKSPWSCLIADRASVYDSLELPLAEGLSREGERGKKVLAEAAEGARVFANGAGRHGYRH